MAKQSESVFETKTPKERQDWMKDNSDKVVMLSGVNFHMLFQVYKATCTKDAKYKEIVKRYTKKRFVCVGGNEMVCCFKN